MCTVVVRRGDEGSLRILALRDELASREFDDPAAWWPDSPGVIGGRDRRAGGTWCASRPATGVTALVLNRPEQRQASSRAPSRGVLPLLAVRHGTGWPEHLDPTGMVSFSLVLASPDSLSSWIFDGERLSEEQHGRGTNMFTSGGVESGKADRFLGAFSASEFPEGWRAILEQGSPSPDPAELVVRIERDGQVFATVFGQLIEATPGTLGISYSRTPWLTGSWETRSWRHPQHMSDEIGRAVPSSPRSTQDGRSPP